VIENPWARGISAAVGGALHQTSAAHVTETAKKTGDEPLYFCVIDRLSYGSLDTALVHVKMQHGMAAHGELLLRTRMLGASH